MWNKNYIEYKNKESKKSKKIYKKIKDVVF